MGQMILGLDKRNPLFTVYHDESGEQLLVYYGFEIVEIVPDNPESAAYKLMLGRLYNSGLKLSSLCETFQVDPKTLRRWGRALKGSPEEMGRILKRRTILLIYASASSESSNGRARSWVGPWTAC